MTDNKTQDIIPDTYPLGSEGPGQAEIDVLKEKNGAVKACFTGNKVYLIRMMTREEYVAFQDEIGERMNTGDTDFDVDAEIATRYTIWPDNIDWNKEPGGSATVLAQEVSRFSGFVQDRESIEL
jgi:hypothetical protein